MLAVDLRNPHQHLTKVGFKKKCDFYAQQFVKFPDVGQFHSYAELLHAALLESDPGVSHFIPQPYQFGKRRNGYKPDCFYLKNGQRFLVELRPEKRVQKSEEKLAPIIAQCARYKVQFNVISNESILVQETHARNWLDIVRYLVQWQDYSTEQYEQELLHELIDINTVTLGEVIQERQSRYSHLLELALYRLAHRGLVQIQCEDSPLNFETRIVSL